MPDIKALILAAHAPSDALSSFGGSGALHSMPIANRPLVSFAVGAAHDAGIDEVAVVVSRASRTSIQMAVRSAGGPTPLWIETPEPLGFADSLLSAAEFLGTSPFLVHSGDSIVLTPLRPAVEEFIAGSADVRLLTSDGGSHRRSSLRPVVNGVAPLGSDDVLAGAHLFGPMSLELAMEQSSGDPGPAVLARAVARAGGCVETRSVADSWTYGGTIDDILEANRMVLDGLAGDRRPRTRPDSLIEGRVTLHPSAVVERTTIRGPAVIGPGAVLRDAFVGPYTALGPDVMLEGVEIEHSIVLAGATIRHPGRRLESSLVGEGAIVSRSFGLPSALRVRVGERSEVRLA